MGKFAGKRVLVTGGSSGIGLKTAQVFAEAGARVAIAGRDAERLAEASNAIATRGETPLTMTCDVSSSASVATLFDFVDEQYGGLDILVNNAGHRTRRPCWELTDDEWNSVVGTILSGTFWCCREAARRWIAIGQHGAIVNIGSIGATRATPTQAHYSAAKGGVRMLTQTLAVELAAHGIRVNAVDPGAIATPMIADRLSNDQDLELYAQRIPVGHVGDPIDIAHAVAYLAGEDAGYITGASLAVDGGWLAG